MMEVARPVKPPTSTKLRIHPSLVSKQRQQNQNQNQNQLVADLGKKASTIITTFCNGGTKRKLANPPPASSQSQQSSKRLKMLAHQSIKNKQEFQWLNDMFKCRSKQLQTPPPPQDTPKSLSPNKQQVTSTSNNIDVAQTNLREALRRCRETAQYKQLQQEQQRQKEKEKDSEEKQRKLERERLRQEARVAMDNVKKTLDLEPSWSSVLSQLQTLPGFDAASWGCSLVDYNFYFPHRAGQPNYNY